MMFQGKERFRNTLVLMIAIVAATVYYYFFTQAASQIRLDKEKQILFFTGPKNTSEQFAAEDILSIELFEDPDYGTTSEGGSVLGSNLYGVWKSEDLGEYEAFLSTRVKACIRIKDEEKTIAFNHSNVDTTRQIYEQLIDYRKSVKQTQNGE